MARPLGPELPGGIYHVTARGNERRWIFRDDADRLAFLDVLARVLDRFGWPCLAYCLMSSDRRPRGRWIAVLRRGTGRAGLGENGRL